MKYNRAYRRERLSHIKRCVSKFYVVKNTSEHNKERLVGKLSSTRCNCSCWMCGNERKYFNKRTIKELSDISMMKLDINELTN